jgi:polysaccharide export outer membrane protein
MIATTTAQSDSRISAANCPSPPSTNQCSGIHAMESGPNRIRAVITKKLSQFRILPPGRVTVIGVSLVALTVACQGQSMMQSQSSSSGSARSASSASAFSGISGVTDEPIFPGEVVSIGVVNAPDFSTAARVSESGEVVLPYLGIVHLAGLNSAGAASLIGKMLADNDLVLRPNVMVTVDATSTGITVLGEVKAPGVYLPSGKHLLSDILAMAGGLTTNTGRVIEISSDSTGDQKTLLPWDPTMRNTSVYDRVIPAGARILVRPCGVAYVGGNVGRPGAYPICASQVTTVSQVVAMASGTQMSSYQSHTILVRRLPDGSRTVMQIDIGKVLKAKSADPVVQADDVIYVPLSGVKYTLRSLPGYVANFGTSALDVYANR